MSIQQGGIETWQCSPSPVERVPFMLDVPGLKKAAGSGHEGEYQSLLPWINPFFAPQ